MALFKACLSLGVSSEASSLSSTGNYKTGWRLHQNMETLSPEQEDFGSFVGLTQDVAKDDEAVCE